MTQISSSTAADDDVPAQPKTSFRSLGSNYHKLLAATSVSNLGDGMATVAYPWLASAITRDPL